MTEIIKTEAFVIKVRKYGESSKIVSLYSEKFGKINAIAKGARKPKSKFANCLDIFSLVSLVIYKKTTTHLHLISDCDLIKSYYKISENLDKYEIALKIFELIYITLHDEEENKKLFDLLKRTMQNLDKINENVNNLYFHFLIKFGENFGYAYNFERCAKCNANIIGVGNDGKKIVFDFSRGGPLCSKCETVVMQPQIINLGILKILNKFESVNDGLELTNIRLNSDEINEIEKFLFGYLRYHISGLRELKSQKILKKLK